MKRTGIKNREKEKNKGLPSLTKPTIFFIILVVIGVIGAAVVIFYVNQVTSLKFDEEVYQYYLTGKTEHTSGMTISNQNMSTIVSEGNSDYSVDPTPFYSYYRNRIYIPKSYSWYSPEDKWTWRVPEFTSITIKTDGVYDCKLNQAEYQIRGGILFDEASSYIFLEPGTITIDYKDYNITPLSFYSLSDGITRLYDRESDSFVYYDEVKRGVKYESVTGYSVDLLKGVYTSVGGESILLAASPRLLENIEERSK